MRTAMWKWAKFNSPHWMAFTVWETWRRLTTQTGQPFNSEFITSANLQNRTWVKHVDLFACLSFLNVWYASRHNNDWHFCGVGVSNGTETQFTLFAMVRLLCSGVFFSFIFSCFCNFVPHTHPLTVRRGLGLCEACQFLIPVEKTTLCIL